MGRELRRVPLDFDWPLNKPWQGFINPFHLATQCKACGGNGYSPAGQKLKDQWYGHAPFRPEDRGSAPFKPTDAAVLAFATRNVRNAPHYYGTDDLPIHREAVRLCTHWNGSWCHHLNTDDVAALVEAGRLMDLTHTFDVEKRWQPKNPPYVPTPQEVNVWSITSFPGHDSTSQWVCVKAECKRLGVSHTCSECDGDGEHWPSPEAKQAYENWQEIPPPKGEGYQIWETVSEGSPISPVFSTARDLAQHMATTKWGADRSTSFESWMKFIEGPGWAPSLIVQDGRVMEGVEAVTSYS